MKLVFRSFTIRLGIVVAAAIFGCFGMFTSLARAQQVPEYLGLYAKYSGKLIALYQGQSSGQAATINVSTYSVQNSSTVSWTLPVVSPTTHFILYFADPGTMETAITLYRLPYVRNVIEVPSLQRRAYGETPQVTSSPHEAILARISELYVRLLAKPVPAQSQMLELVPSTPLAPGTYVIDYSPSRGTGWYALFNIGEATEGEPAHCIDLVLLGGVLGAIRPCKFQPEFSCSSAGVRQL